MSRLIDLGTLTAEGFTIVPLDESRIALRGLLALRDPSEIVGGYLKKVHAAAESSGVAHITIDVTGLQFMNSSAIRVFIDWVQWVKSSKNPYKLRFITDRSITWQRSTFSAVQALGSGHVSVEAQAG